MLSNTQAEVDRLRGLLFKGIEAAINRDGWVKIPREIVKDLDDANVGNSYSYHIEVLAASMAGRPTPAIPLSGYEWLLGKCSIRDWECHITEDFELAIAAKVKRYQCPCCQGMGRWRVPAPVPDWNKIDPFGMMTETCYLCQQCNATGILQLRAAPKYSLLREARRGALP